MNREEAIKKLKEVEGNNLVDTGEELEVYDELLSVALDMAIEALSNQQKWIDEELQNYLIENADLVTCKDCKHWASAEDYDCEIHSGAFGAEDFCSYGERKGGDEK